MAFSVRKPDEEDCTVFSSGSWNFQQDDRHVLSGIVYVIRNGLSWKCAESLRPHTTSYNRFIHWNCLGVFDWIVTTLTEQSGRSKHLMLDTIHLKGSPDSSLTT
ncbi:transposase [Acetobacter sp.]|uniref:transposase n=1 Tax=Acetobacter sp. TaxID=440 RepID=UPI0039ECA7D9